jgi:hypothetical protein
MHNRLKHVKDTLMCAIEGQMANLNQVDTKELGEAIDMIKDLEEAIYYCTITKAMEEGEKQGKSYGHNEDEMYYRERYYPRDMDRNNGRMYYPEMQYSERYYSNDNGNNSSSSSRNFSEKEMPMGMYDYREGRSPKNRRMYMEAKETHQDKVTQMRELEKYMQELSQDIVDMIGDASPEEKQYLEKKLTTLASKVS